ncbi:TPA: phage protease, partial [Vibrio cholerae]
IEAEIDYLTQFGQQQGVAALSAMLEKRPAIAALTAKQTKTQTPPADHQKKDGELTQDELAVLSATGLTQEQYLAAKKG